MRFPIDQIWVDDDAADYPLTREILRTACGIEVLTGRAAAEAGRTLALEPDPFLRGKRILRLVKHRGAFVKPCPGTREYICCGLLILHIGQGCPMDCRYCALQVYFNRPVLEVFVNTDDLFSELAAFLAAHPDGFHRFCTGEFTDSLALEPLTGVAQRLVEFFSAVPSTSLELKTKTNFVGPLLDLNPFGRVILSFSVNADTTARREELRSAPLKARLAAAAQGARAGYRIGFHFDPIIPSEGWQERYAHTIDEIFDAVPPEVVAWISLGALRFVPALKDTAGARFGPIPYFHDGFVAGLDGKSRLHVDRRIEIYRFMSEKILSRAHSVRNYLCMESSYVWRQSLGMRMESNDALATYLNAAVAGEVHAS
ncbi:MAG: DNA photolyase [Desulfomonile sp.]|nr:DNA photolyase [Desulfomonile sp.]